ncbi:probable 60S ribosomal protein L14 isoform X2 [Glycine soja]|uniref:probable 60S ribosomal protein L14 isoform X2 n=1 Tax=Glycine soja TaxID=3848 RepID=UPI001039E322|nr:probable 60S ribosomal protein L14 isoform X2 [Glycine soja]
MHPFKRYVEIGRVAQINYGKKYGRLVVIVDVIDQNKALVDAPDMVRSQVNFKRLSLTDIKIDIKRVPKKKDLVKAMEDVVSLLFYRLLLLLILSLGYN